MNSDGELIKFERLFGLLLVFVTVAIFLNSALFSVKRVQVSGNKRLTETEIIRLAAINFNQNIFGIDGREVRSNLAKSSWIAQSDIQKKIPNTILIKITERSPLAWLVWRDQKVLVAEDGAVLEEGLRETKVEYPAIVGVNIGFPETGQIVNDSKFTIGLEILKLAGKDLRRNIMEIDLAEMVLRLRRAQSQKTVTVLMGEGKDLDHKLYNLKAILSQLNSENISEIDLRSPDLPTVLTPPRK